MAVTEFKHTATLVLIAETKMRVCVREFKPRKICGTRLKLIGFNGLTHDVTYVCPRCQKWLWTKTYLNSKEAVNLVKVSDIYKGGGNYLNTKIVREEGLVGKNLTIKSIDQDTIGDSSRMKLMLGFNEIERRLALNTTNAGILVEAWGDETDGWNGKALQMVLTKTKFKGDLVDSIQVIPQKAG